MIKIYDYYFNPPPKVNTVLTSDETFVSQSEVNTSSLSYMMSRYGMDTVAARLDAMRSKFGYADCTKNNDFATIQNQYVNAVNYFNALPSEVRRNYNDDPVAFYDDIGKNPDVAHQHGFIDDNTFEKLKSLNVDMSTSTADLSSSIIANDKNKETSLNQEQRGSQPPQS